MGEPERLLRLSLSQIADAGDSPHFLLIDEIQSLEGEYVRRFQQDLQKRRSLISCPALAGTYPIRLGEAAPACAPIPGCLGCKLLCEGMSCRG
jgi:hypothetical protein